MNYVYRFRYIDFTHARTTTTTVKELRNGNVYYVYSSDILWQIGHHYYSSCPLPPKPDFRVLVWEGFSGGCRAGLTLKRCSQLAAFAIQSIG